MKNKKQFPNARAHEKLLVQFILVNVTGHRTSFEVGPIKGDGTVTVGFRSSPVDSASDHVKRFCGRLVGTDTQFRDHQDHRNVTLQLPLSTWQEKVPGSV